MSYYTLKFSPEARKQFDKLDKSIKTLCDKKLQQLKEKDKKRRHLKFGENYYVDEVGQYKIIYEIEEEKIIILILFIGKHKQYETYLKIREEIEEYNKTDPSTYNPIP